MAKFDLLTLPFAVGARLFGRRDAAIQHPVEDSLATELTSLPPSATRVGRPRPSLALIRLLDADCPSCRGFGCAVCFDSGLA